LASSQFIRMFTIYLFLGGPLLLKREINSSVKNAPNT